jgi:hypothetical protein
LLRSPLPTCYTGEDAEYRYDIGQEDGRRYFNRRMT